MDMVLGLSVNLKLVSLFSAAYVVGTHWNCLRGNSDVYLQYVFPIIKCFTISFS